MLISIDLIDDGRGVHLTAAGPISGAELVAAHRHIERERRTEFADCEYWLSDYSETRGDALLAEHAREIAEITRALARINDRIVLAAWAGSDLEFGMARMWQNLSPDLEWPVLIDRRLEAVSAWLEEQVGRPVDLHGRAQRVRWFEHPGR